MKNIFRRKKQNAISPKQLINIMQNKNKYIIGNIDPNKVVSAINTAKKGELYLLLRVLDELITSDSNLDGNIDIRIESMKSRPIVIQSKLSDAQQKYFKKVQQDLESELINIFMHAKLKRAGLHQVEYEMQNNLWMPTNIISYDNLDLRVVDRKLALFQNNKNMNLDFSDPRLIGLLFNRSILQQLLKYYVYANFMLNAWSQLGETYGKPWRLAKYEPGNDEVYQKTWEMVQNMGDNMAAIIPNTTQVEFLDFAGKSASSDIYNTFIKFCESKGTQRILGTTVVTEDQSVGSNAKSQTAQKVTDYILAGDARDCSRFLSGFYTKLNHLNFNPDRIDVFINTRDLDLDKELDMDIKLENQIGIYMDDDYYYDKYNRPRPQGTKSLPASLLPEPVNNQKQRLNRIKIENNPEHSNERLIAENLKIVTLFRRQARKHAIESAKKIAKQTKIIKEKIAKTKNIEDLEAIDYSDFTKIYGRELKKIVTYSAKKGYKSRRKKGAKIQNLVPDSVENSSLDDEILKLINIDWGLDAEEMMDSFETEALKVAAIETNSLKSYVISQAQKFLDAGKTFKQFRDNIKLAGYEVGNPYHLRTQFNTGINGAFAGGQWKGFEADADIFPGLEYISALLDTTRDEHAAADGTVLPVDDPWWDTHMPPNDWNCLCTVRQLTLGEMNNSPKHNLPPAELTPGDDFMSNPGKCDSIWGEWIAGKQ